MNTTVEAYEQNNGCITVYALQNGSVVWSNHYSPSVPEIRAAAFDFLKIAFQAYAGIDPIKDFWEGNMVPDAYDNECGDIIADSAYYSGRVDDVFYPCKVRGHSGDIFTDVLCPKY